MPWFRRKKDDHEQQSGADTPAAHAAEPVPSTAEAPPEPPAEEAAAQESGEGSGGDAARPKRRRGSRGGRSRKKKPAEAVAEGGEAEGAEAEAAAPAAKSRSRAAKPEKAERGEKEGRERKPRARRKTAPRRAPLPAAKRELLVSVDVTEKRVAVLEDDRVAEVYLERPERRSIAGNIYLGTVDNVLPGMEAAFVEIGLEKNGFLYVDEIVGPELEGRRHGKKIQDLISRGQQVLVQAVKDPMKTKGARLTTDISLPGRFVVFVPNGEGLGVSRRLDESERDRLRDILKKLDVQQGGVIIRTAAEGASAEDIERDLVFLQRLWKTIQARAKQVKAPALVYQEAELPLRLARDLFTGDFERALIDDERTFKRVVGFLKKTSPHMIERVERYKEKTPLFDAFGVEAEIKSTLSRRVDLPSGGYLVFDYAEAFTVVDVNTGRFVGSRSKNSTARLEDTITQNNLEAVKEVVRQLRLRDIGGIIVIDFIDMANPKNRASVEEALRTELERDRTKTYVVEISPLGLVEMTRQNVTDGPREILTRKCPTCGGDGIILSEASAAVDIERRLRALATSSPRAKAFRVELSARVASALAGPGAERLVEIESQVKRRFFFEPVDGAHLDHFVVVAEGAVEELAPEAPVREGEELQLQLVELGLYDQEAAEAKVDGYPVVVAGAAKLVGKKVKARVERALPRVAYATLVEAAKKEKAGPEAITFEAEAEKPTRAPRRKTAAEELPGVEVEAEEAAAAPVEEAEETAEAEADAGAEGEEPEGAEGPAAEGEAPKRKRTRRGSRGGRGRKRPTEAGVTEPVAEAGEEGVEGPQAGEPEPAAADAPVRVARIHVPDFAYPQPAGNGAEPVPGTREEPQLAEASADGGPEAEEATAEGEAPKRKRTRRGSRGGRGRKRKPAGAAATDGAEGEAAEPDEEGGGEPGEALAAPVEADAQEPVDTTSTQ